MKTVGFILAVLLVLVLAAGCSQKEADGPVTASSIYRDYQKLQDTPSGDKHAERYYALQKTVRQNQDALYELVFSGKVTDEWELADLISFGGHGGSVAREYNRGWAPFMARVRARQDELPESIQDHLDWLLEVHGW